MIALLLLLASASAFKPICNEPYAVTAWSAALDATDAKLAAADAEGARQQLAETHRALLCLRDLAPTPLVGRMAQLLALTFFYDQDENAIRRWSVLARLSSAPPLDDARFPDGHPFRTMYDEAEDFGVNGPEGVGFVFPPGGGVFLNGALLTETRAPVEVPGLLQVFDRKGAQVEVVWIDGSAFPEELLGPAGPTPVMPKALAKAASRAPKAPKASKADPVAVVSADDSRKVDAIGALSDDELLAHVDAGDYVDPFTDARRRALVRSVTERELVGADGAVGMVRTEVITFVSDPSGGKLVTQDQYAKWLVDYGEWSPGGSMAKRTAGEGYSGEGYLSSWSGGKPPSPSAPVTRVTFAAARAYCRSWGNDVAGVDVPVDGATRWEWRRQGDQPELRDASGAVQPADARLAPPDAGFRCAP